MKRLLCLVGVFIAWPALVFAQLTPSTPQFINNIGVATGPITIPVNGIATTSTDGLTIQNTTLANSGATVQMSGRFKMCGTALNSSSGGSETNCFFIENLPATVAGTTTATFKIGYIAPGGAVTYPLTLTNLGGLTLLGSIQVPSSTLIGWSSGSGAWLFANANGQIQVLNAAQTAGFSLNAATDNLAGITNRGQTTGMEINTAPATLGTCTGGTITTGSHSTAGGYTGNTSSSCVVNFSTSWTNAPFCVAMSIASTTHPRVSATAVGSITITGGVSGEAITYLCWGRIGT
jgi:hypothetical protein